MNIGKALHAYYNNYVFNLVLLVKQYYFLLRLRMPTYDFCL